LRCKSMVDLPDDEIEPIRMKKRAPKGFRVHRYSVEIIGLCPGCAQ
jgi:Fe2+ or Zn2+ uptake regulation protein